MPRQGRCHRVVGLFGLIAVMGAAEPATSQTLTAFTWNVSVSMQGDTYARGQMAFIAGLDPRPEVVAIQEANYTLHVQSDSYIGGLNAASAGVTWTGVFARSCAVAVGSTCSVWGDEGILIATSLPVTSAETKLFFHCDYWHAARPAARLAVTKDGTTVQIFNTHLQPNDPAGQPPSAACPTSPGEQWPSRRTERLASINELKRWAARYPGPRLLGGDFNAGPESLETLTMAVAYVDAWRVAGSGVGNTFRLGPACTTSELSIRVDYWFSDVYWVTDRVGAVVPVAADQGGLNTCYSGWQSDHVGVRVQYRIFPPLAPF
jgi:hypothetical protein